MKKKMVWVELNVNGDAVRIFKNRKAACAWSAHQKAGMFPGMIFRVLYAQAVGEIRHLLWARSKGECELCGSPVTEKLGQMHERQHRGKGGEISMDNSVFACEKCHTYQHRDRNPHFTKKA